MNIEWRNILDLVRQPEYTGENRCLPCTVVNLVIAVLASAIIAVLWLPAAMLALPLFVLAIALRGYLVPGTPGLTKRYLPESVLKLFDQHEYGSGSETSATETQLDVQTVLLDGEVIGECPEGDDLCLHPAFRDRWHRQITRLKRSDAGRGVLADALGVDEDDLDFYEHGSAFVATLKRSGERVRRLGQWESEAAFLADAAAATLLEEQLTTWPRLSAVERSRLLQSLRLFLDTCPSCGGAVRLGEDTVESCCRMFDVVAVTCEECDSRLFEVELDDQLLEA